MSDFLTRMVERAMGTGASVQPLVTSMIAPGLAMADHFSTMTHGERIEPGPVRFTTESEPIAKTSEQVKTTSADVDVRPSEEIDVTPLLSDSLLSNAGSLERSEEWLEREPADHTTQSSTIESASIVAQEQFKTSSASLAPASSKPQVSIPELSKEEAFVTGALDSSEIVPSNFPEQAASSIKSPSRSNEEAFAFVSHRIQRREQQFSNNLLMEEVRVARGLTEHGEQPEKNEVIERTVSSGSTPDGIRPKTISHREQPVAGFSEEDISTPRTISAVPTIKVSIGRIEVRAIAPPPPPAKSSAPSIPKISLDDYLKKQSGVKR